MWLAAHAVEAAAAVFFGLWIFATILYQFNSMGWLPRLAFRDYFALIPLWTFFAPNPGTTDVHLLYRDKLGDGTVLAWREVPVHLGTLRSVWNPDKRLQKGLSDLGGELQMYAANHLDRPELILTHAGLIALLNFVSRRPHAPATAFTQFAVVRSYGRYSDAPADVTFLSAFHRI